MPGTAKIALEPTPYDPEAFTVAPPLKKHRRSLKRAAPAHKEKRNRTRYTVDLPLRYRVFHRRKEVSSGAGRTIDMSSEGLLFATDRGLDAGMDVELYISWPVRLSNGVHLQLFVLGRIVRVQCFEVAVRMTKCEFRTRAAAAQTAGPAVDRYAAVEMQAQDLVSRVEARRGRQEFALKVDPTAMKLRHAM